MIIWAPENSCWIKKFRFNEKGDGSDALVDLCTKFLPDDVNLEKEGPYKIQPNFDVDMNLIGYYDTRDNRGGDLKELTYLGDDENGNPIYEDNRQLRKYYKKAENGEFLNRFKPEYAVWERKLSLNILCKN